jgi:superfamily II DNA or RNA helicase
MKSYQEYEEEIAALKKENKELKELLRKNGIVISQPDQQVKLINRKLDEKYADYFYYMFWGRQDVYAKGYYSKNNNKFQYSPTCVNGGTPLCPRYYHQKQKCSECVHRSFQQVNLKIILNHLQGKFVMGIYPLFANGMCRLLVFDFDNHEGKDEGWKEEADTLRKICRMNKVDALVERSRSGNGAHVWIFFAQEIEAKLARAFGNALLEKGAEMVSLKSFRYYDRMIPMQDSLKKGQLGNLIALPLQPEALQKGCSAFVDENWQVYPDQWNVLLHTHKLTEQEVRQHMESWKKAEPVIQLISDRDLHQSDDTKPWQKTCHFQSSDLIGKMDITLADALYINTENMKPRMQNQIRSMAAFSNPKFYKNQAMGISNYDQDRLIYLGADEGSYIRIPRGLFDMLTDRCREAGISCQLHDERETGSHIQVTFRGKLRPEQEKAAEAVTAHDTGILHASTAFGKTVVCCSIIARKKVNTLIVLESTSLVKQWQDALNQFLVIDEDPPSYLTPGGQTRKRKSVIGILQGARDTTTGIIDIAMARSLCRKGEFHDRLSSYGMVIVDECHHAASETITEVLQQVKARYVYGVTATPKRSDGLQNIIYMMIGPIRFTYSAKQRAVDQGIAHLVYPRFTRTVKASFSAEKLHPNEAYQLIHHDRERNELIIRDTVSCLKEGRTPVILTKYVDHAGELYERLKDAADHAYLLKGNSGLKQRDSMIADMKSVLENESILLIATGKLLGEGFDFPRLDTLMMAAPVAFDGVVEQYVGRLNRDALHKEDVIVYDYVDVHIPMFDRMYHKRLRAYKKIGYDLYAGQPDQILNRSVNAIYEDEEYLDVWRNDMHAAEKEIILSSPKITEGKVKKWLQEMKKLQHKGVRVVLITWTADMYHYGDASMRMALLDEIRQRGIEVNLVEDYFEHFCIIDRRTVWYGSVNMLGKEDYEDNLMRVESADIDEELVRGVFTKAKYQGVVL